ncbi:MAG: phosphodiester glycosidase family protein, partial [Romboutsia sp.]|nr:phosphodiester glycosidase family protein [Romboutsia sp.]
AKRCILYSDGALPIANTLKDESPSNKHILIANGIVKAVATNSPSFVPDNSYLYSIGNLVQSSFPIMKVQDSADININFIPQISTSRDTNKQWNNFDFILGGTPLLIYNGKLIDDYSVEGLTSNFFNAKDSRTAIGILENNNWLLVVIERNNFISKSGVSIKELAEFMLKLNCQYAINLDGGSSSAMYIDDKINQYTEKEVEYNNLGIMAFHRVSNAILLTPSI